MSRVPRSPRSWILASSVVIGLVLALGAALMLRDAFATREALVDARAALADTRGSLRDADVGASEGHVERAVSAVRRARARTDGPVWWVAKRLPIIERTAETITHGVGIARASVELSAGLVPRASELLGSDGELPITGADGQLDLEGIRRARVLLDELDGSALERSRDALRATPATLLPGAVLDGRREALELADQALATVGKARALTAVLPDLLGAEGGRRYLLAVQNNAELRGTGGLIGFVGELAADDGAVSFEGPIDVSDLESPDAIAVQVPEEFERRYAHVEASSSIKNVNVDPDLPMTAPVLLQLYEEATGRTLDGVIAVDPVALQFVSRATGAVDVPDELLDDVEGLPDPVPADELARVVMFDAYEAFGGSSEARDLYLEAVLTAAFERLVAMDWDPAVMTRRVGAAAAARHLQIYSIDENEQAALESLGVAGALGARDWGDVLAVSANNAAANKQDVHVGHGVRLDLTLRIPDVNRATEAERHGRFRVTVDNPLPTSGMDPYVIGSRPGGAGADAGAIGPPGLNRTWFTVWSPDTTRVLAGRDGQGDAISVTTGEIHGLAAVDHHLETPSRERRSFELDLRGPVELRRDGPDLRYRLTLWRQAKAIPDELDVLVRAPRGWRVDGASLSGDRVGEPVGLGTEVLDGPEEPSLDRHDGYVRVRGETDTDIVLELRFSRGWAQRIGDRLSAWLGG